MSATKRSNYKVREHSFGKVPVILAVGGRVGRRENRSVRRLGEKQTLRQPHAIGNGGRCALAIEAITPDLRAETCNQPLGAQMILPPEDVHYVSIFRSPPEGNLANCYKKKNRRFLTPRDTLRCE